MIDRAHIGRNPQAEDRAGDSLETAQKHRLVRQQQIDHLHIAQPTVGKPEDLIAEIQSVTHANGALNPSGIRLVILSAEIGSEGKEMGRGVAVLQAVDRHALFPDQQLAVAYGEQLRGSSTA